MLTDTLIVTASAVNANTVKGAMNRNELWSSESELDFSDEEIDMSRSVRLMVTVYSYACTQVQLFHYRHISTLSSSGAPQRRAAGRWPQYTAAIRRYQSTQ